MEPLFRRSSARMGVYAGVTAGGFVIDESWRENDGLVNTVSAMAPLGAPSTVFDPDTAAPGIWQILPTCHGDHMSLQGGMMKRNDIRPFYLKLPEAEHSTAGKRMISRLCFFLYPAVSPRIDGLQRRDVPALLFPLPFRSRPAGSARSRLPASFTEPPGGL